MLYMDEGARPEEMSLETLIAYIERLKAERDAYNRLIAKMKQQMEIADMSVNE